MNTNDAVAVLRAVRNTLQYANDNPNGGINDTIWMMDSHETLFDFIDTALAATDSAATVAKDDLATDDIEAICDAYESGVGHGMKKDGHDSGNGFANRDCGRAYEIGYAEGVERVATPKPEASAATQQVRLPDGFVWPSPPPRKGQSPVLFDDGYEEGWAKCIDALKGMLAAPISEDTGKGDAVTAVIQAITGEEETETRSYRIAEKLRKRGISTNMTFGVDDAGKPVLNIPAAPVSDGDAMPPLPKQRETQFAYQMHEYGQACIAADRSLRSDSRFYMDHGLWHDRVTGQHMYTQDQYDEESRTCLKEGKENAIAELTDPARTVTGSGGSIGEDAEFQNLLSLHTCSSDELADTWNDLVRYVNRWASRNAGVAAPDTSAGELTDEQIIECADEYNSGRLNPGGAYIFKRGPLILMVHAILAKSKGQS